MDVSRSQSETQRRTTLSQVLKRLRVREGYRTADMAREMGVALRTYQRFESGALGIDFNKIFRFARVVDADPWGIIFAAEFGSVGFAIHAADNHAASLLLTMLRRFDRRSGKDIAVLDPRSLVKIFSQSFEQIPLRAERLKADLEQWMFDEAFDGEDEDDD
jgi:transcriptional regulator with XRE-family HTH domain